VSTGRTVVDNCTVIDSPEQRFCRTVNPFAGQTQLKFHGVYPLPWDFQASAVFQNLSGIPIQASQVFTNAQVAPSLGRNLGACGNRVPCNATLTVAQLIGPNTIREDRLTQVDVRLTRIVRLGPTRLQAMFDVYNLFNASTILAQNNNYGSTWLRPTQILAGRLFKFGVQVDF
jgi:hypothetical protein